MSNTILPTNSPFPMNVRAQAQALRALRTTGGLAAATAIEQIQGQLDLLIKAYQALAASIPTLPSFVGASAYASAAQSIPANTVTAVLFDTNVFDTSGIHSTTSNTSRFTAQVAGYYYFLGQIEYAASVGGNFRDVLLRQNGTTGIARQDQLPVSGGFVNVAQCAAVVHLLIGDYLEVLADHNAGAALNADGGAGVTLAMLVYLGA